MTVSELIKVLQRLNEEIGCDGIKTAAHSGKSHVTFDLDGSDVTISDDFEVEPALRIGCGCWDGVRFKLKLES